MTRDVLAVRLLRKPTTNPKDGFVAATWFLFVDVAEDEAADGWRAVYSLDLHDPGAGLGRVVEALLLVEGQLFSVRRPV